MSSAVLITIEIPDQLWEDAAKFGIDFAVLYLISLISMGDNGCWKSEETRWRFLRG
jgi:hypothetical protein